jgi:hypothetical protein
MPGEGLTHGPPAERIAGGSHHRISWIIRHSLRDGFTAYSALSPGTGFLAPVARNTSYELGISTGMPGPHGFAVRTGSFVGVIETTLQSDAPTAPRLHVRDDRETPLFDEAGWVE